jgi:hypothetical protein
MKFLLSIIVATFGLMAGVPAQAWESQRYYAAVENACGQDPRPECIGELKRLCGKPASNACISRNQARLDAATERGFAKVRRSMGAR